jgi:carboxymethylenebutenolidase
MGKTVEIEVPGVGNVGGWLAEPDGRPRSALVVVQEIFGVNAHMRDVADGYAREGFLALAPALFDPVERDVELDYDNDGFKRGRELVGALGVDRAVAIVDAAARRLRADGVAVGAVGFCWGGTIAYLANTRLGLPAVSYYGARTVQFLGEPLRAPMMFHFGEQDESIPAADIAAHAQRQPDALVHVYPAGHAFNRDVDPKAYVPGSARLARQRTLEFFGKSLSGTAPS